MVQPWRTMFYFLRPCSANSVTRTAKTMSDMLDCSSYELRHRLKDSDTHNQKLLHISAMAKCFSLWMVAKKSTIQQCIAEGKLCCHTGKESDYSYIGASSDREKAVEYANNQMAKEQLGDDWRDHCVMVQIHFSAKGVALYCTTLADNVLPPTPMLRNRLACSAIFTWYCIMEWCASLCKTKTIL